MRLPDNVKFYDFQIVFDNAVVKGILSTDNITDAIEMVSKQVTASSTLEFKQSFAVERKIAKVLAVHSITVICPECKASNYIPDLSAVDTDPSGFIKVFCEKCRAKYFLLKDVFGG